MKDQYGRTIEEPRKVVLNTSERGVNKKAIRLMTILLFLTAAIIFVYPSGGGTGDAPTNNNAVDVEVENVEDTGEYTLTNGSLHEQTITNGGIKDYSGD